MRQEGSLKIASETPLVGPDIEALPAAEAAEVYEAFNAIVDTIDAAVPIDLQMELNNTGNGKPNGGGDLGWKHIKR